MDKLVIYLVLINIIAFICYGVDKYKAIVKGNRISERFFYSISFIGGFIGSFLGMQFFRHKTLKFRFYLCNIISMLVWIYLIWFCL